MPRIFPRPVLRVALLVLPSLVLACAEPGGEADDTGAEGEAGAALPSLGDTPLPACEGAMFAYEQIAAELSLANPDPAYLIELYRGDPPDLSGESPTAGGSALQRWVREVGARLGRVEAGVLLDDAAIESALSEAFELDPNEGQARAQVLAQVLETLRVVASLDVRERLASVAEIVPDPEREAALVEAQWDTAYCVWSGVFAPLADEAEGPFDVEWDAQIVTAFESGHAGIRGPVQAWAPDEYATKPAKQIVEKSNFAVVERLILARAKTASEGDDGLAAREALGLFAIIKDRILDRNTPAVEAIEQSLAGEPAQIDPGWLEEQLAIAFVKRARKYCDEAVVAGTLGTPDGVKGAWEGIVYTQIVVPLMVDRLADFDAASHMQLWRDYLAAVEADEASTAIEISERLVESNCALQMELGIAACTSDEDEPG